MEATGSSQFTLQQAHQLHQAGKLGEAALVCYQVLEADPGNAEALNLAGVVASQQGNIALAAEYIEKAIAARPQESSFRNNLGNLLLALGREAEAAQAYREAIRIKPSYAQAHFNLGNLLSRQLQLWEAVAELRTAIELKPDFASAYNNLGSALWSLNEGTHALAAFRSATELDPRIVSAHFNLGIALASKADLPGAAASYRKALALDPRHLEACLHLVGIYTRLGQPENVAQAYLSAQRLQPDAALLHYALANVLSGQGMLLEAVAEHRLAIERRPDFADAHAALGSLLLSLNQAEPAVEALRNAVRLKPEHAGAHFKLGIAMEARRDLDAAAEHYRQAIVHKPGCTASPLQLANVYKGLGKMSEAVQTCRDGLKFAPNDPFLSSGLLYCMMYDPSYDSKAIYEEHCRWSERHEAPLRHLIRPHTNDRSPERKLKVGYVSPNFHDHCLAFMYLPLFRNHDRESFEIYLYSNVRSQPDRVTAMARECADVWCHCVHLSDQELADRIRDDGIDILVDLSLHLAYHRMMVMARKPAPVQVTWLGYPGTTGLSTVDYRLTDRYLDPPGLFDAFHSEESVRLPDSFWCYDPLTTEHEVNALPALENGYITFGCLNAFCKINDALLHVWARILAAVPDSRLRLLAPQGHSRQWVRDIFQEHGVPAERLEFADMKPRPEYLKSYGDIDLCLDPLPYNGHTTSLDSLWMGVPIVSSMGETVMGRAGWSQSFNLGLSELVAPSTEGYVALAIELANDLPRLAELRRTIRPMMQASPLMDGPRFARGVEAAYRQMWRRWCQTK